MMMMMMMMSLNVVLRAGHLSVRTAGGVSDRHWLKACLTNWLTYLLTRSSTSDVAPPHCRRLSIWYRNGMAQGCQSLSRGVDAMDLCCLHDLMMMMMMMMMIMITDTGLHRLFTICTWASCSAQFCSFSYYFHNR